MHGELSEKVEEVECLVVLVACAFEVLVCLVEPASVQQL